ncbi:hypothetical protein JL720_1569 [Aureococcus anophagefferens]|nr:hypothetical protein JL720_1569 [Aureococcus anophagefferens]
MDTKSKLDTLWKKGVGEMKNLASKADQAATRLAERSAATAPVSVPGEHQRGDASGAEDISREDLLQLTMKLSKRLKSSESSNAALTKEARRFMLERDALRKAVSAEVLGRPGALEDVPLREGAGSSSEPSAALLDALSARRRRNRRRAGGATATLKTALEAALAGRDGLATKLRAAEASLAESRRSFEDQVVALRLQLKSAASGKASAETLAELAAKDATIAELAAARDTLTDAKATLAAALAEERALAERRRRETARGQPPRDAHREARRGGEGARRRPAAPRRPRGRGRGAPRGRGRRDGAPRAARGGDARSAAAACAEAAAASATSALHTTTIALGAVARAEAAAKASRDVADARTKAESDHAKRSSLARSIMAEKDAKLRDLAATVARLEADLSCGGHENRAFVEIANRCANRQAAREGAHAVDLEAAKVATKRLQTAIKSRDAEMADLASKLLAAHAALDERAAPGDGPNLEYVKNVVVQYMSLVPGSSEHASLVPVLATVLDFSDDDVAALRAAARKHDDDRTRPGSGPRRRRRRSRSRRCAPKPAGPARGAG